MNITVENQAGGHRGIMTVWRGVILAPYVHINPYNRPVCVYVCVCGGCALQEIGGYGGLCAVILACNSPEARRRRAERRRKREPIKG